MEDNNAKAKEQESGNGKMGESAAAPSKQVCLSPRKRVPGRGGDLMLMDPLGIWTDMDRIFDRFRTAFDDILMMEPAIPFEPAMPFEPAIPLEPAIPKIAAALAGVQTYAESTSNSPPLTGCIPTAVTTSPFESAKIGDRLSTRL